MWRHSPRWIRGSSATLERNCASQGQCSPASSGLTNERWKNGNRGARNRILRRPLSSFSSASTRTHWRALTNWRHGRGTSTMIATVLPILGLVIGANASAFLYAAPRESTVSPRAEDSGLLGLPEGLRRTSSL